MESAKEVEKLLQALGERLEFSRAPRTEIAVCGGAALMVMGLMTRSMGTKDIDAFALLTRDSAGNPTFQSAAPLPLHLKREADVVAEDFNLPKDWLNPGPTRVLDFGLPQGLAERLHPVDYGPCLTVHFLDRVDQVHFKLYAAIDCGIDSRHAIDLKALNPTEAELESAARWAISHNVPQPFTRMCREFLTQLGRSDVADRL